MLLDDQATTLSRNSIHFMKRTEAEALISQVSTTAFPVAFLGEFRTKNSETFWLQDWSADPIEIHDGGTHETPPSARVVMKLWIVCCRVSWKSSTSKLFLGDEIKLNLLRSLSDVSQVRLIHLHALLTPLEASHHPFCYGTKMHLLSMKISINTTFKGNCISWHLKSLLLTRQAS